MSRGRQYERLEEAESPETTSVNRIKLTGAQVCALAWLKNSPNKRLHFERVRDMRPFDTITDWGLAKQTMYHIQITDRGREWLRRNCPQ